MEPCGLSLAELGKLRDEDVVSHLKAGHADALAVIFNRYHSLIFTVAFKILRDVGEAEDVMQAVFLELYKSVAQYDPSRGTLKVWILQFAYHRSINRREYLNVRKFYQHDDIDSVLQRPLTIAGYGMLTLQEIRSLLRQGLEQLTADQRRTLEAVFFEGLTCKEIAEKTGESVENVRHFYYRGLDKLRTIVLSERQDAKSQVLRRGIVDAEA
jgi:RNA polymerase sigma-70 factor, ECF subfamily